jgi:hypothetical protein
MQKFRVEFKESTQQWHHEYINKDTFVYPPNTYGWVTIIEQATDVEFRVFDSLIASFKKDHLSVDFLKQLAEVLPLFIENLRDDYGYEITSIKQK